MFLGALQSKEEKEHFISLIINIGKIDGDFTENEKNQVLAYANEMGITLDDNNKYNDNIDYLIDYFANNSSQIAKKAVFIEIIALMLVDGMKDEEEELLNKIIEKFNFNETYKKKVINWYSKILPLYSEGFKLLEEGE